MPTLFIPSIGDKIKLLMDTEVNICYEYRNAKALYAINPNFEKDTKFRDLQNNQRILLSQDVIIPAETVLTIDRIYIRKGKGDFDSVTFRHDKLDKKATGIDFPVCRFWLKLDQINDRFMFEGLARSRLEKKILLF